VAIEGENRLRSDPVEHDDLVSHYLKTGRHPELVTPREGRAREHVSVGIVERGIRLAREGPGDVPPASGHGDEPGREQERKCQ
jgi:hypothetical protein